jgi:hypothetical protein
MRVICTSLIETTVQFLRAQSHETGVFFIRSNLKIMLHIWGFLRYATILDGLAWLVDNNLNKQQCYAGNNRQASHRYGIRSLRTSIDLDSVFWESFEWRHPIVGAGRWRVNEVYAEVPLWSASGPVAQRWIVLTCVWKRVLEDSHKRSCWKNSTGVSVPRPCGSDAYVCSKSFWLFNCSVLTFGVQ